MTASDVKIAVLHRKLSENMDAETADALIERLPPDWEQLATKDLAAMDGDSCLMPTTSSDGESRARQLSPNHTPVTP